MTISCRKQLATEGTGRIWSERSWWPIQGSTLHASSFACMDTSELFSDSSSQPFTCGQLLSDIYWSCVTLSRYVTEMWLLLFSANHSFIHIAIIKLKEINFNINQNLKYSKDKNQVHNWIIKLNPKLDFLSEGFKHFFLQLSENYNLLFNGKN